MEKIKANAIIEIAGAPEEHVKETMNKVVNLIKENKDLDLKTQDIAEPKENEFSNPSNKDQKVKIWSTLGEFEIEFKDFDALTNFCFEFMPSSIEIIEPLDLKISANDMNNTLNDILARLHHQSKIIMEYAALKKSLAAFQQQKS